MRLNGKSVLVTGAGGFIGSHLSEKLLGLGCEVRSFVRYNSRNDWGLLELISKDKLNEIEVITGDLNDTDAVYNASKDVDVIFHLGSIISIPYSYLNPRETIETNIIGTLNVLNAARLYGVDKIIHTSTSEVYGSARYVPINETHPLQAQSPYSASKIGCDKIAESYFKSFDLPVSTIRPFNTFGPRQSARAVIPTIITQALIGNKINLGSLHPTRDYTYVDDTTDGFIKIAESSKSVGEIFNIGSNFEISIRDLAQKILYLLGKEEEISIDSDRIRPINSEVERLWCDNTKAKKIIGWKPKIKFEDGLKETIDWVNESIHLYKPELYNR